MGVNEYFRISVVCSRFTTLLVTNLVLEQVRDRENMPPTKSDMEKTMESLQKDVRKIAALECSVEEIKKQMGNECVGSVGAMTNRRSRDKKMTRGRSAGLWTELESYRSIPGRIGSR